MSRSKGRGARVDCAQATRNLVYSEIRSNSSSRRRPSHRRIGAVGPRVPCSRVTKRSLRSGSLFLGETWRLTRQLSPSLQLLLREQTEAHSSLAAQLSRLKRPRPALRLFLRSGQHDREPEQLRWRKRRRRRPREEHPSRSMPRGGKNGTARRRYRSTNPHRRPLQRAGLGDRRAPHGARVGTVDRFQGSRSAGRNLLHDDVGPEEDHTCMEFLFQRHRLNVATSRARCVCILVGNPRLSSGGRDNGEDADGRTRSAAIWRSRSASDSPREPPFRPGTNVSGWRRC